MFSKEQLLDFSLGSNSPQPQVDLDLWSPQLSLRNMLITPPRPRPFRALILVAPGLLHSWLHSGLLSAGNVGSTSVSNGLQLQHLHEIWGFDLPEADRVTQPKLTNALPLQPLHWFIKFWCYSFFHCTLPPPSLLLQYLNALTKNSEIPSSKWIILATTCRRRFVLWL